MSDAIATVARAFREAAVQDEDKHWHADYRRRMAANHGELAVVVRMLLGETSEHTRQHARRLVSDYDQLWRELAQRVEGMR